MYDFGDKSQIFMIFASEIKKKKILKITHINITFFLQLNITIIKKLSSHIIQFYFNFSKNYLFFIKKIENFYSKLLFTFC